ncbi:MAG TPA: hypothetical protein VHV76_12535 [Mycobacteriales bacterium]|nr:hypothetical protein [Mycobacteriales bacterium]
MHRAATAPTLRAAWQWWRDNCPPDHPRRGLAADAYTVLGDPRRRATYDEDHPHAGRKNPRLPKSAGPPRRPSVRTRTRRSRWSAAEGVLLGVAISGAIVLAALVLASR